MMASGVQFRVVSRCPVVWKVVRARRAASWGDEQSGGVVPVVDERKASQGALVAVAGGCRVWHVALVGVVLAPVVGVEDQGGVAVEDDVEAGRVVCCSQDHWRLEGDGVLSRQEGLGVVGCHASSCQRQQPSRWLLSGGPSRDFRSPYIRMALKMLGRNMPAGGNVQTATTEVCRPWIAVAKPGQVLRATATATG